ncbi:MAG: GNAT family N-acetyltransferase [Candidatus Adiutrix sp.]|jgi:GNAT superfamily N-acetyltransferase|nr:GNAT family N-acetyltransferase [Candidatus Adiutrix sp.]
MGLSFEPVTKLSALDKVEGFSCGKPELDRFLERYAWINQKSGGANTYVLKQEENVIGYYSLAAGQVERLSAPERVVKGLAGHPVPVILLARLAVAREFQRQGAGRALLKDALLRTLQAGDIAGIRALLVHAKDEEAKNWYLSWNFEPSPTDPLHLFLLLKDIAASLKR